MRVAIGVAIGLAIPLYYARQGVSPEIIGIIASASAFSYLFSPFLFKDVPEKIGKKYSLLVASGGFLIIQIFLQFFLDPLFVFIMLLIDGVVMGLHWPVLLSSLSVISTMDEIKEGTKEEILVYMDTDTSRENVTRAAISQGCEVKEVPSEKDGYCISIQKN